MEAVAQVSVGGLLRAAFLRGETVVITDFAKANGFTRQGVQSAIRPMERRNLLTSTTEQRPKSGVAIVWRCVDMAGMEAYQPKSQNHNPMLGRRKSKGPFTALLEVWGIGHADIRLPAVQHFMNEPEVSL